MFRAIKSYQTMSRLTAEHGQDIADDYELNSRWSAVGEAYQAYEVEQKLGETSEQAAERRRSQTGNQSN